MIRSEELEPALVGPSTLIFLMLGAFLCTCGGMWFSYENNLPDSNRGVYFTCAGLMTMGVAMIVVGLGLGRMDLKTRSKGREALRGDRDQPAVPKT